MSQVKQTSDEIFDSLTGHEEMWIADQFEGSIGYLLGTSRSMYVRALIFVVKRREGINEDDARNAVMDMRLREVIDFFPEATDEDDETAKVVEESGKGETAPEQQPTPSLSSAS